MRERLMRSRRDGPRFGSFLCGVLSLILLPCPAPAAEGPLGAIISTMAPGNVTAVQEQVHRMAEIVASGHSHEGDEGCHGAVCQGHGALAGAEGVHSGGDVDEPILDMRPYYAHQNTGGEEASSGDSLGVAALASIPVSRTVAVGGHAALERTAISTKGSSSLNSTSTGVFLGVHAHYTPTGRLFVRGQVSGLISGMQNRFTSMRDGDRAENSPTGYGLSAMAESGYAFALGDGNTITPELALSVLWSRSPSMTVGWRQDPAANIGLASQRYTALLSHAALRWEGLMGIGRAKVHPMLMVGLRQVLTSGKIRSRLSFEGQSFDVSETEDRTVGLAEAGMGGRLDERVDAALTYRGEYGKTVTAHAGFVNVRVKF